MQGIEDELVASMHNQASAKSRITQGDRHYFTVAYNGRLRSHLINCKNEVDELNDAIKRLDNIRPNADTDYAFTHLTGLHKSLEQAHIDFADRKMQKYVSLLRKWKQAIVRNDFEVAQQCYDGITVLKSAKNDPRMQTLIDQIKHYDTLNIPSLPRVAVFNALARRKFELNRVIEVLTN